MRNRPEREATGLQSPEREDRYEAAYNADERAGHDVSWVVDADVDPRVADCGREQDEERCGARRDVRQQQRSGKCGRGVAGGEGARVDDVERVNLRMGVGGAR